MDGSVTFKRPVPSSTQNTANSDAKGLPGEGEGEGRKGRQGGSEAQEAHTNTTHHNLMDGGRALAMVNQ